MKRFLKFFALFGLIILTTGCGSQFKDEATVTIDAEPIILAAIKAKRNARDVGSVQEVGSPDGHIDDLLDDDDDESAYDDIQFTKEMIAAFDEAIEYKVDFKCSLTGDYKKTQTETIAISFSDMMQLEEVEDFEESTVYQELEENLPDFKFSGVPVGSRIKANVIMTLGTRIKDEDKLFDLILGAAYEGMTEQEIALAKLSLTPEIKRLMKNEFLDYFSMEELITAAGTSDEITVVEGSDNPIEVMLEFDVEIGFGSGEEGSISYTRYYYLDGYKENTLTDYGHIDEETADELYDFISEQETCPADLIDSGYEYEVEKIIIEYTGTEAIEKDWLKLNEEEKQALCEDILQNAGSITIYCYIKSTPIKTPVDDVTSTFNLYENNIKVDTSTEELTRNYTYFKYTFEGLREIPDSFDDDDYIYSIDKILITYTKDTDTTPETVTQDWLKIKDDDKDQFCKDMVADATAITVDYYVTSTPKVIPLEKYTATGSIVLGDIGLVTVGYDITEPLCLNIGELSFWAKDSNGTAVTDIDMEVKLLYGGRDLNEFAPLDDPYYLYSTANKTLQIEKRLSTAGTYQLLVTASVTGQSYVSNSVTLNFEVPDTIYYDIDVGIFNDPAPPAEIMQLASIKNGLYLKFQGTGTNYDGSEGTIRDVSKLLDMGFASDDVTFDLSSITGITRMELSDFGTAGEMKNVTKLILPDSLERISTGAIWREATESSTPLTLVIGENVNSIIGPYKGSYNPICKFEVSPDNANYCTSSDGKYLMTKDGTRLVAGANMSSVTIPDSVLIIDRNAFYGADLVTSINLNNVEVIFDGAFYSIYNITVEIPARVRAVGTGAFTYSYNNGATLTDAGDTAWALTKDGTKWESWVAQGFATEGEYSEFARGHFNDPELSGFVYAIANDGYYAYRLFN